MDELDLRALRPYVFMKLEIIFKSYNTTEKNERPMDGYSTAHAESYGES